MSPQSRRGRGAAAGHRKPSQRPGASTRPAPAKRPSQAQPLAESDDVELQEETPATPAKKPAAGGPPKVTAKTARPSGRPAKGSRGVARVRRNYMFQNAYGYFKAYIPIFLIFIIVFGAYWGWVSFGPHTPTPLENWQRIANIWEPKRDTALVAIGKDANDMSAQIADYTQFRDATKGWMDDLSAIKGWENSALPSDTNAQADADMNVFIQAGRDEIKVLDKIVAAKTSDEMAAQKTDLDAAESTFESALGLVVETIVGAVPSSSGSGSTRPTLNLPTGHPCPSVSPSPTASPSASPSESATVSGSPSASITASPVSSPSEGPSASPTPYCVPPATPSPAAS